MVQRSCSYDLQALVLRKNILKGVKFVDGFEEVMVIPIVLLQERAYLFEEANHVETDEVGSDKEGILLMQICYK